ncbi:MAG: HIT family protein [Clostridiales bacterium]|nr:HIT family protein [Clostridiales bacterium]MDD6054607.1 HIT family protein [Clostridiales bacterium]
MKDDCIFCKIIKGEIPSYKIYEDEKTYAFLDIKRDIVGHTLVIPKKHFTNILDCDGEYLAAVMETVKRISRHYVEKCGFDGVNLINCSGVSAQQSVFHLHIHIIPRRADDNMNLWPLGDGDESMDLAEIAKMLEMK